MKAALIINNIKLELGHKELNEISYILDNCKKAKDIYHELAQSPSTETRTNIVSQKNLHRKTVKLLLSDHQIDVIRTMINKKKFDMYECFESMTPLRSSGRIQKMKEQKNERTINYR